MSRRISVASFAGARDRPTYDAGAATLLAGVVVLLGVGLIDTQPNGATVIAIAAAIVLCAVLSGWRPLPIPREPAVGVFAAGLALETYVLAAQPVLDHPIHRGLLIGLGATAIYATLSARWRRPAVVVLFAGYSIAMVWMLAAAPHPPMDVILFNQDAAAALVDRVNPYGITFDNLYGHGTSYYAPELQVGERLRFGFVYPPLSLLMAVPGYLLGGDYRYSLIGAVIVTAALMLRIGGGWLGPGAASLVLLAPITPVVIYWGWTEPFLAVMCAAAAYFAATSSRSTPWALGLAIAVKQHAFPILLIAGVLLSAVRRRVGTLRFVAIPVIVAAATVLPFAIWDLGALIHSTITVQLLQPFRLDALTVPALLARFQLPPTPPVLGFVAAAVALGLVLWRAPRTVAGFCHGTALVYTAFFLFNKHAFVNYYWFVLVMVALGIAATRTGWPAADPQTVASRAPVSGQTGEESH